MPILDEDVIYEAVELSNAVQDISYFFEKYEGSLDDDLHIEDIRNKIEALGFELDYIPNFRRLRPLNQEDVEVNYLPYLSNIEGFTEQSFADEYETLFSNLRSANVIEDTQASTPSEAAPYLVIIEEAARLAYESDLEESEEIEEQVTGEKEPEDDVKSAKSELDKMMDQFDKIQESNSGD